MKKFKSILNRIIEIMPIICLIFSAFASGADWNAFIISNDDVSLLVMAIIASIIMVLSTIAVITDVIELNCLFDEDI